MVSPCLLRIRCWIRLRGHCCRPAAGTNPTDSNRAITATGEIPQPVVVAGFLSRYVTFSLFVVLVRLSKCLNPEHVLVPPQARPEAGEPQYALFPEHSEQLNAFRPVLFKAAQFCVSQRGVNREMAARR